MAVLSREEVESRLNSIARLRLIFNTTEELNAFIGFNSGPSNSLSRIGGCNIFIKNAVYDSLCRYVDERSGLDFDEFLTEYRTASEFYEKRKLSWLSRKNNSCCYELLRYFYMDLHEDGIKDKRLASLVNEVYDPDNGRQRINVLILVLLVLKMLPLYSKGRGDATDILSEYDRLFTFLSPLISDNGLFQANQSLEMWKDDIADDPDIATRFNLYNALYEIIDNHVRCTDKRALYLTNLDLQRKTVFPMGDRMWKEGDSYWRFEALDNGYFATQYVVEPVKGRIGWTRYECIFSPEEEDTYAYILNPKGILNIIRGKKLDGNDVDTCLFSLNGSEVHRTASFKPVSGKNWFKERTMTETDLTYDDFLVGFREYSFVDKNPQATYRIISMVAAVTRAHIFIPDGDGRYFRIPKSISPVMEYTSVNDNAGLFELELTKERIIGFVEQGIYINVTRQNEYESKGIILTPTITIP